MYISDSNWSVGSITRSDWEQVSKSSVVVNGEWLITYAPIVQSAKLFIHIASPLVRLAAQPESSTCRKEIGLLRQ